MLKLCHVCLLLATFIFVASIHGQDDILSSKSNPDVKFFLFTKQISKEPLQLKDINSIKSAPFIKGPMKVLLHGYASNKEWYPGRELIPAYLESDMDLNIISVDYPNLVKERFYAEAAKNTEGPCLIEIIASFIKQFFNTIFGTNKQSVCYRNLEEDLYYRRAVANTEIIAMSIAQFLDTLLDNRSDINLAQIHVIGFSLGCHIAGQIKNHLKHGPLERITALDAALPLFRDAPKEKRIDDGDANFVDALHTDALHVGFSSPIGHIDFFANGGYNQPGCNKFSERYCAHIRACELYAASINPKNEFWAYHITAESEDNPDTKVKFGEYVDPQAKRGEYYFNTSDKPPFVLPTTLQV